MKLVLLFVAAASAVELASFHNAAEAKAANVAFTYLGDLVPERSSVGWGSFQVNRNWYAKGFKIAGKSYTNGVFAHAPSKITYDLEKKFIMFSSCVGLDDANGDCGDGVDFKVLVDGKQAWTKTVISGQKAVCFSVNTKNARKLTLVANHKKTKTCDESEWVNAKLWEDPVVECEQLGSLTPSYKSVGWGSYLVNKAWHQKGFKIGGQRYYNGVFAHANSNLIYPLHKKYDTFTYCAGLDDANGDCGNGVVFKVLVDGVQKWSQYKGSGEKATCSSVGVKGASSLNLVVNNNGRSKCDESEWVNAHLCTIVKYEPVDCLVSSWAKFSKCSRTCGTGYQKRVRKIKSSPEHGGKRCPDLEEVRACNSKPCPIDCKVTKWEAWTPCTKTCGGGRKERHRSIRIASTYGGKKCSALKQTEGCNADACPVNCKLGEWQAWTKCTKTCGKGSQKRSRKLVSKAANGGKACGARSQTRACNVDKCPIDCVVADFGSWSKCSRTCGTGYQHRYRSVKTHSDWGGKLCPGLSQSRTCATTPCPINCVVEEYTKWSKCTRTCNGGTKYRTRGVQVASAFNGKKCPALKETLSCNSFKCPINCQVTRFGTWSACTKSCGTGNKKRRRSIKTKAKYGGVKCPHVEEIAKCMTHACPIDCVVSNYGKFTKCSKSCGSGFKTRYKGVVMASKYGGKKCPATEQYINDLAVVEHQTVSCILSLCPADCEMSSWSKFSTCSKTCGSGTQTRTRKTITKAANGGKKCPGSSSQTRACNTHQCAVDCKVTKFGAFGACSASCGSGKQARTRTIKSHPQFGGKRCPSLSHSKKCNTHECPVDCEVGIYGKWTACTHTCGGGTHVRTRPVVRAHMFGGKKCGRTREAQSCNTRSCPVACKLSKWSTFGLCNKGCGGGLQWKSRTVVVQPAHGGKSCGALYYKRKCNVHKCAINCEVTNFADWTACSRTCGSGTMTRTREVVTKAKFGAKACPETAQSRTCNTKACPINCVLSAWNSFSQCTKTCGMGFQFRLRTVKVAASNGGKKCGDLREVKFCNQQGCPVDCKVGKWSDWTGCTKTCGSGKWHRSRQINQRAKFGGKACPELKQSSVCNKKKCPVHCVVSEWSEWTVCSKTCGTGSVKRTRGVLTRSAFGGKLCPALEGEKACNEGPCPVNCQISKWSSFNPCTKTCGGGKKTRTRSVITSTKAEGTVCPSLSESVKCGGRKCPVDCVVSAWSAFKSCSKTCGGGLKSRTRTITKTPAAGGVACPPLREQQRCNTKACVAAMGKINTEAMKANFAEFSAKDWKNFDWESFSKKSREEQLAFKKAHQKASETKITGSPTPAPTTAAEKTCTNGPFTVKSGWAGAGYGDNYCNLCKCNDGNMRCQTKDCGVVNRGKKCSHTKCNFVYSAATKSKIIHIYHHHSEHNGASHHCAYNLVANKCQCNCFGASNTIWRPFSAKRDNVDKLFGAVDISK